MKLVVTGKSGQVASALLERGAGAGVEILTVGRPEIDLGHRHALSETISRLAPDVIVSAAAYTAVDKAETDIETALAVNGHGPSLVASAARDLSVPLIHLSTDYVFDGSKTMPYVETDPTNPISVYGRSKLAGERAVAEATSDFVILRTAWVYSPFGNNFLKTMLRLAADRPEIRVVDDQHGNPTSALDIAEAILTIANNVIHKRADPQLRGVFHLAGNGEASWADFATEIFAASATAGGPSAKVVGISGADYPTPARRPANSRLSSDKLERLHGVSMPRWQISTGAVVSRLVETSK